MDKDINPIVEESDFLCSREKCPAYNKSTWEQYEPSTCKLEGKAGKYCIIGYRRAILEYAQILNDGAL